MLGTIVSELLYALYATVRHPLDIVETGTLFQTELEPGEIDLRERSTCAIARFMQATSEQHHFHSIDLDSGHIDTCKEALGPLANYVQYIRAAGEDGLRTLTADPLYSADFALLDADSNAQTTRDEFEVIRYRMAYPGIIVIDDAFKPESVNKGRLVMASGVKYFNLRNQAIGIGFGEHAEAILRNFR